MTKIDQEIKLFKNNNNITQTKQNEMTDTQTIEKTSYAVALVFSGWPLAKLCMFLEDELGATQEQIGVMRIDRVRGQETNRTIMLLDRLLLDRALESGFTGSQRGLDFKMNEYEIREHNLPKDGYTRNFYIPLPKGLPAPDAQAQLENKIAVLGGFGMFGKTQPRLKIPLVSRESGEHRGRAFITFARETSTEELALARILLHDTRLYTTEEDWELMKCFWAKERAPRSPKGKDTKRGPKKPRRKAPSKKALTRDQKPGPKKAPPKPIAIEPLKPGENKWDKPLAPVPATPDEATDTDSASSETVEDTTEVIEPVVAEPDITEPEVTEVVTETVTTPVVVGLKPLEFPPLDK